jgi:hypothetical protein
VVLGDGRELPAALRCALSLAIAVALYRAARLDGRTRGGLALLVTWAICSGLPPTGGSGQRGIQAGYCP